MNYESLEQNKIIECNEIEKAIKSLKNNEAMGTDKIKNEFIKNGGEILQTNILKTFNHIFDKESIPSTWQEGTISHLYKGKGDPETLSNGRGITVSSNLGKLFERIINNRATNIIPFSEAAAGGRRGRGTTDQLFILKSIIEQRQYEKRPLYLAFLDVEKAYDKAWSQAIMHILWKCKIRGKLWRIIENLNSNLTAKIKTRYGLTRIIKMGDSIRQGGVLSVVEYAKLIDELETELQTMKLGISFGDIKIASLLYVDDIILLADNESDLQLMLNQCCKFALKWHIKFSQKKSKVMVIQEKAPSYKRIFNLGKMQLDEVTEYCYLGEIINKHGNLHPHLESKKNKVQATTQTILSVGKSSIFKRIGFETKLKLYKTCIVPSILYACETWLPNTKELEYIEALQIKSLKQLMQVPQTTPSPALLVDTGLTDLHPIVIDRQLMFYWHLSQQSDNRLTKQILNESLRKYNQNPNSWPNRQIRAIETLDIGNSDPTKFSKRQWKVQISKATRKENIKLIIARAGKLSKMKNAMSNKTEPSLEKYLQILPMKQAALIFKARYRMLPLKCNFKGKYKDQACPRCSSELDNEKHLIEHCSAFNSIRIKYPNMSHDDLFSNDSSLITNIAQYLEAINPQIT